MTSSLVLSDDTGAVRVLTMALGCDFLVASARAVFADTHARVGILPAAG